MDLDHNPDRLQNLTEFSLLDEDWDADLFILFRLSAVIKPRTE